MNTKKTKRIAVVLSIFLVLSLIVSGLTVFADTTKTDGILDPTSTVLGDSGDETTGEVTPIPPPVVPEVTPEEGSMATVSITQPSFSTVTVTYEKAGDVTLGESATKVVVHSGEQVPMGTRLTIALAASDIEAKVVLNGEAYVAPRNASWEMDYTVDRADVTITATAGVSMAPYATGTSTVQYYCSVGGTAGTGNHGTNGYWINSSSWGAGNAGAHSWVQRYGSGSASLPGTVIPVGANDGNITRVNHPCNGSYRYTSYNNGGIASYPSGNHTNSGTSSLSYGGVLDISIPATVTNLGLIATNLSPSGTTGAYTVSTTASNVAVTGNLDLQGVTIGGTNTISINSGTLTGGASTLGSNRLHINGGTNDATLTGAGGVTFTSGINNGAITNGGPIILYAGVNNGSIAGGTITAKAVVAPASFYGTGNATVSGGAILVENGARIGVPTPAANTNTAISGTTVAIQGGTIGLKNGGTGTETITIKGSSTVAITGGTFSEKSQSTVTVSGTSGTISGTPVINTGTLIDLSTTVGMSAGTVNCSGHVRSAGKASFTGGTMNGKFESTGTGDALEINSSTGTGASGSFIANNGTATLKNLAGVLGRIQGNTVVVDNTYTGTVNSLSSKTGATLNNTGTYREVFAGGLLVPHATHGTATIGMLYVGSDISDVSLSAFKLSGDWKIGAMSFGGRGTQTTGSYTVTIDPNQVIGQGSILAITNACGFTAPTGTAVPQLGDVYMGGNKGATVNKVTYNNTGTTINGNLYGGLLDGTNTVASSDFTLTSGKVVGNVYGGNKSGSGTVTLGAIKITGGTIDGSGGIFGGGRTGTVTGSTVTMTNDSLTNTGAAVYGGGAGGAVGTSNVRINTAMTHEVYGGGTAGNTTIANVYIGDTTAAGSTNKNVYGGGKTSGTVGTSNVTIGVTGGNTGAVTGNVYGGANGIAGNTATVATANTTVTNKGSVTGFVFGGGTNGAGGSDVTTNATVVIAGTVSEDVYGGGETKSQTNNTNVTIQGAGTVSGGVFGGGRNAVTSSTTTVNVATGAGVLHDIFGGGYTTTGVGGTVPSAATVNSKATVIFAGQSVPVASPFKASIYGGGWNADTHSTEVTINHGIANATATTSWNVANGNHIFGGGKNGKVTDAAGSKVTVNTGADILANVYGGGRGTGTPANANVTNTVVTITTAAIKEKASTSNFTGGNVFGGGENADAGTTTVHFNGGTLKHNVYGGADNTGTVGTATVNITGNLALGNNVYGGGRGDSTSTNPTTTDTIVSIGKTSHLATTTVLEHVFGGGRHASVTNDSKIIVTNKGIVGANLSTGFRNVYGGAFQNSVKNAIVEVHDGGIVWGHVYGSGRSANDTYKLLAATPQNVPMGQAATTATTTVSVNGLVNADTITTNNPVAGALAPYNNPNGYLSGNVYGGSDLKVTGTTLVTIGGGSANANVQFVFGGGDYSSVGGLATVNVVNGTINREVYGGSAGLGTTSYVATVNSTAVNVSGGTVKGNIHGGGFLKVSATNPQTANKVAGNTTVTISGGTLQADAAPGMAPQPPYVNVYGGGNGSPVDGLATVELKGMTATFKTDATTAHKMGSSVYGGGTDNFNPGVNSPTNATLVKITSTHANQGPTSVYAGGQNSSITTNTKVTMDAGKVLENIYGGGEHTDVSALVVGNIQVGGNTEVVIGKTDYSAGATVGRDVFGGGYRANVNGTTNVKVYNATVEANVFGGGDGLGEVPGTTTATIGAVPSAGTVSTVTIFGTGAGKTVGGNVFGGGWREAITNGSTAVTIANNGTHQGVVIGSVHGGGWDTSTVNGNTVVEVQGNIKTDVLGGGWEDSNIAASAGNLGDTKVTVTATGYVETDVFGAGDKDSHVAGNTTVVVDNGGRVKNNVYGAGRNNAGVNGTIGTNVLINGTVELVDVFGGGIDDSIVAQGAAVRIGDTGVVAIGSVYGGGHGPNASPIMGTIGSAGTAGTQVTIEGIVGTDVFGGGWDNSVVEYNTIVTIEGRGVVGRNVFGGGTEASPITNTASTTGAGAKVTINGFVGQDVFGGGWKTSNVANGYTTVDVNGAGNLTANNRDITGAVARNVFGGGWDTSNVSGYARVTISGTQGMGYQDQPASYNVLNVFGGGWQTSEILGHDTVGNGTTVTINSGSVIKEDVHGGGWDLSPVSHPTASTLVRVLGAGATDKALVKRAVYGGGLLSSPIANFTWVDIHGILRADNATGSASYSDNNVYGGGFDRSDVNGQNGATVTVYQLGEVKGNVFGGGRKTSHILGAQGTNVTIHGTIGDTGFASTNHHLGAPYEPIRATYLSYPTYMTATNPYPSIGNVFGGGTSGGGLTGPAADQSIVGNIANNTVGTRVYISESSHATGVIYGGGFDSEIISPNGGTDVIIKGAVSAVHGGGRQGDTSRSVRDGSKIWVTGSSALVWHDVYGGGYGENIGDSKVTKTDILINNGANVRERVFGGGHGGSIEATTPGESNIIGTANIVINDPTTLIGHKANLSKTSLVNFVTGLTGNLAYREDRARTYLEFFNRYTDLDSALETIPGDRSFNTFGQVYGGGNDALVDNNVTITIDNNHRNAGQKVYDRISGGSLGTGKQSNNGLSRDIQLKNFGVGDYEKEYSNYDIAYCKVEDFAVIRYLQDYTTATTDNSFLTVYYNLKAYDNGKDLIGGQYATDYTSTYTHDKGIYHPWTPQPHTNVTIEPEVHIKNVSKFRIRGGYSVTLKSGIFLEDVNPLPDSISLLIDLIAKDGVIDETVATTTKIYSTPNNVTKEVGIPFRFTELPRTIFPRNITYSNNNLIQGVNFYIPPREVGSGDGEGTNPGGTTTTDRGTGGGGGAGGGGGGGGGAAGGGIAMAGGTTATVEYLTSEKTVVNADSMNKLTTDAVTKAGAGKTATMKERLSGQVAGDTLRSMQVAAKAAGGSVLYHADTVRKDGFVEGRMYIDPAKASGVKGVINTMVYSHPSKVTSLTKLFSKYYTNRMVFVKLAHEGDFGMSVRVAAKVDIGALNQESLLFYSFNAKTNSFKQIQKPNYSIDKNGYIHFDTMTGGDIVITDSPLQAKK